MKHWQETEQIVAALLAGPSRTKAAALATVVGIEGSTYRRPGAKLLVWEDGSWVGAVSGGCLEKDLQAAALEVIRTGRPRHVRYNTSDAEDAVFGFGLGCNGTLELEVQPVRNPAFLAIAEVLQARLQGHQPLACCMRLDPQAEAPCYLLLSAQGIISGSVGESSADGRLFATAVTILKEGKSRVVALGDTRYFVDVLLPPPEVFICGAADDSIPLAHLASLAGLRVQVVDHRPAYLTAARFPAARQLIRSRPDQAAISWAPEARVYAVIKTHALELDKGWFRFFQQRGAGYLGLMGPRHRREEIIAAAGTPVDPRRVFGPVGLDLGAEGAEQIAVSMVAEILAVHYGRGGGFLRDRPNPIHP